MESPPPDERWQQLLSAMDPERNLRAMAQMVEQAASASEQVVSSVSNPRQADTDGGGPPLRDAVAELERSFNRLYDAAGQFMVERPMRSQANRGGEVSGAEIAVLDGVGTTVVSIPGATGQPHCGELRRHDQVALPADVVSILRTKSFENDDPTFVIRVDVANTVEPGLYIGLLLVEDLPDWSMALMVRVVVEEE